MTLIHLTAITAIQAEAGDQASVFLEMQDLDGFTTVVRVDLEPNVSPVRDLLVRAINSAARAAKPVEVQAEVVILPRRNGLAFGDPTRPLGGGPGDAA